MEIVLLKQARKDIDYWKKTGNKTVMYKISALLGEISVDPYTGKGKPEPLRYELSGKWSRRINSEHRIIYSVHEDIASVYIYSLRYHYP